VYFCCSRMSLWREAVALIMRAPYKYCAVLRASVQNMQARYIYRQANPITYQIGKQPQMSPHRKLHR
jgi:hypothetical protein